MPLFNDLFDNIYRGKTIGFWPFKKDWYSICSRHQEHNKDCNLCIKGSYCSRWKLSVSAFFFKFTPRLWTWWVNRKDEPKCRQKQ
jgi:hypothetical protein